MSNALVIQNALLLQFTEEKMGRAERTENDPQFGILSDKTDTTKNYTEKIVKVQKT